MMLDDPLLRLLEQVPGDDPPPAAARVRDRLAATSTWAALPPELMATTLTRIRAEREHAEEGIGAAAPVPIRRATRRRWLAVAAAVLFIAGGGSGWIVARSVTVDSAARTSVAGTALAPDAYAVARVRDTPTGVSIALDIVGLPAAAPGTFYQAWLKSADGRLVAIGTFHQRGGATTVQLWAGVSVTQYPIITVTLQREGAGTASSGQVVLRGDLRSGR